MAKKTAVSKYLAEIGRKGGKKSGKARMEKMTAEQRTDVAKNAATARWGQAKLQDGPLKGAGDKLDTPKKPAPRKKGK